MLFLKKQLAMNYQNISTERQFKSTTGHSKLEFEALCKDYELSYIEKYSQSYEDYLEEYVPERPGIFTLNDWLFFVLFQLKNDLVYDSLGAVFNMNGSTANSRFKEYLSLLEYTLKKKNEYPKREFKDVADFENHLSGENEIIFDGTENPVERPENYEKQRDKYSGKKKLIQI